MKKIVLILVALIGFGVNLYGQELTSDELKRLSEKYPNAVRVYQDRKLELEKIIREADVKIEYLTLELKLNTGEEKGGDSLIHKQIDQERKKIKDAKRNLESAYRHYRSLISKK
jgi:hypothetical protein